MESKRAQQLSVDRALYSDLMRVVKSLSNHPAPLFFIDSRNTDRLIRQVTYVAASLLSLMVTWSHGHLPIMVTGNPGNGGPKL